MATPQPPQNTTQVDQNKKTDPNVLSVEVRNPDRILYSGPATAVSSKNSVGPLDILPQHENFISLLTDKIVIHQDKHQKQEIPNQSAIVKAKANRVSVFLGVETLNAAPLPNPGLHGPLPNTPTNNQKTESSPKK